MLRFARAASLALGALPFAAIQAFSGEYQCQQDGSALRIAIEVKKAGHTLPCEVVLEEDRGEVSVLYSAQFDRDYCPERLEKTRAELEADGWICRQSSVANIVHGTGEIRPVNDVAVSESADEAAPETIESVTQDGVAIVTDSRSCSLKGDSRRLRIEVEDPQKGRPCSLIYWSETDQSQDGQLLWRAEHDADFCTKRLGFIVEKWTDEGWRCDIGGGINEAAPLRPAPSDDEGSEQQVAAIAPEREPVEEQEPPDVQAAPVEDEDTTSPLDTTLQAIIEADAARIGEWMEVEAKAEVVGQGDLNADGADDVVVFLGYQSDQSSYRQYLMSYLAVGGTYELAGVKLLTGVQPPPAEARLERIDQGVIWLTLADSEGARLDPIGYELRDQQLVPTGGREQADVISN